MIEKEIERKVFDKRTLLALYQLKKSFLKNLESLVKEGKESLVFSAKDKTNKWIALKIYRVEHCDFKSMWKYLIEDPRFFNLRKERRHVVLAWAKREFKNLSLAWKNKLNVPKPIALKENILVMDFLGIDGKPFPRLIDVELDKKLAKKILTQVLNQMEKLISIGLVHSDLSAYNLLLDEMREKIYLIDFSQAVTFEHPLAKQFLLRDIKNVLGYFKKYKVDSTKILKKYENLYQFAE